NRDIASLMNRVFINIKVDREERPDIDKIYMSVTRMMTGSGGWPLTIIMTPLKDPFFAATYIPKENRSGQTGLLELIPYIDELWKTKRKDILASTDKIKSMLKNIMQNPSGGSIDFSIIDKAYNEFHAIYDSKYGGFGGAPKFPSAHNLSFLLNYWKKSGNQDSLEMVENTLQSMRMGGIWDHVGYGFHRYSTDRQWVLPHFEKMLYDQAIASFAYLEAYQATGKKIYKETAEFIFNYVKTNMESQKGGFYSAEDADSEGEEGTFYLWNKREIKDLLGDKDSDIIQTVFNIRENGNYRDEAIGKSSEKNILYRTRSYTELAKDLYMDLDCFSEKLGELLLKLYDHRKNRIHPFKDDKILTDWNGLMAAAYARGGSILDNKEILQTAEDTLSFIFSNMSTDDGGLFHTYREGEASIRANLDDYAFVILALIELYQSTFKFKYIKEALKLQRYLDEYFWDKENGGYFFTDSRSEELIFRHKECFDGAVPSGNSVSMLNLIKLGRITMDTVLEKKASRIGAVFAENINNSPVSHSYLLSALAYLSGPSYEIFVVDGKNKDDSGKLLKAAIQCFIPNKVIVYKSVNEDFTGTGGLKKFIDELRPLDNKSTAFICKNYYCELPVTEKDDLLRLLDCIDR
ncbi:MAG: thioredoxin domain-containing protein, partial [Actinobacteria bacterium]|nr:thioredoxin domain-containing protein [Actinomycetota bacterium]